MAQAVITGTVPLELLEGGIDACASADYRRMLCWALQRVTGITASEHILCGCPAGYGIDGVTVAVQPRIVVFDRSHPSIAIFTVDVSGPKMGCVEVV